MKRYGELMAGIAAAEIESFLLLHPAVHMAQVVGAPDARYAEVPGAGHTVPGDQPAAFVKLLRDFLEV